MRNPISEADCWCNRRGKTSPDDLDGSHGPTFRYKRVADDHVRKTSMLAPAVKLAVS